MIEDAIPDLDDGQAWNIRLDHDRDLNTSLCIDRQGDLLMSLFTQLTDLSMLPKLPGLAYDIKEDFATDLSPIEINRLVCLANNISSDQIKFYEIGLDMVTPTVLEDKAHSQVMIPNFELIRPYVEQFINGTLP